MEGSTTPKTLFAFGLNYKTAPVEIREKLFLNEAETQTFLRAVKGSLSECIVLSTCNRTEIYGVSDSPDIDLKRYKDLLINLKNARGQVRDEHFFALISCAACQQLFNVATSIDSKIIGDSQILRQLRGAYSISQELGHTGKVLNQLVQRSLKLGKTIYTETSIHDGAASVSHAAVELAVKTLGSLQGRTVLVLGAGETARLTAEALVSKRVGKIFVSNRTRAHAEDLLSALHKDLSFESEILDFDNFKDRLEEADIIISSTGSETPILYKADFAGRDRKILVIDIAVPRDVDDSVRESANVIVKNIDDLHSIIDGNQEKRMRDLPKVKELIIKEMVEFLTWYYLLPIMPAYGKTGAKPSLEQTNEILRIKEFLNENVSEIHKFAARAGGNFREDLESHFSLIKKLQLLKGEAMGAVAA
jgi:glutamyl-tRNA reductase